MEIMINGYKFYKFLFIIMIRLVECSASINYSCHQQNLLQESISKLDNSYTENLIKDVFAKVFPGECFFNYEILSGGHSGAKIYKVNIGKRYYVLRHSESRDIEKLSNQFILTKRMGEKGISPRVHYDDAERGIIVMDYISSQGGGSFSPESLKNIPGKNKQIIQLIKKIHEYSDIDSIIGQGTIPNVMLSIYKDIDRKILNEEEIRLLERIINTPWPNREQSFVHNDLYSGNILYDGYRFWILDWELSGMGHPFYDLAYYANFQDMSQKEGIEVLCSYLEKEPSCKEIQEFHLMRRLAYGFNAAFRLSQASKMTVNGDAIIPLEGEVEITTPIDLFRAIDNRSVDFSNARDLYRAGIVFLRASACY